MTAVIVFVLHAEADKGYALAVAEALTSHRAVAVDYASASSMRFGRGSICLALCSRAPGAVEAVERALSATPSEHIAVGLVGETAPMPSVVGATVVRLTGDVPSDATRLRETVARLDGVLVATTARRKDGLVTAPKLAAHGGLTVDLDAGEGGRVKALALRSATGVALTFAVVAAVSHVIGQRAMATDRIGEVNLDNAVPHTSDTIDEPTAAPSRTFEGPEPTAVALENPTPAFDRWVGGAAAEESAQLELSAITVDEVSAFRASTFEPLTLLEPTTGVLEVLPALPKGFPSRAEAGGAARAADLVKPEGALGAYSGQSSG